MFENLFSVKNRLAAVAACLVLVILLFLNLEERKSKDFETTPLNPLSSKSTPQTIDIEIQPTSQTSPNKTNELLGNGSTIDSEKEIQQDISSYDLKKLETDAFSEDLKNRVEASSSKASTEEIDTILPLMKKLFEAVENEDWDKFLESSDEMEMLGSDILNLYLYQAVLAGAPSQVIENLLHRGAKFSAEITIALAIKNNVGLIQKLIPLGLDIHVVDRYGRNSLYYIMDSLDAYTNYREVFMFFLNGGIELQSTQKGLDALNLAISKANEVPEAIYYVESLVDYGAPINKSHSQQVNNYLETNPALFRELVAKVPKLLN